MVLWPPAIHTMAPVAEILGTAVVVARLETLTVPLTVVRLAKLETLSVPLTTTLMLVPVMLTAPNIVEIEATFWIVPVTGKVPPKVLKEAPGTSVTWAVLVTVTMTGTPVAV